MSASPKLPLDHELPQKYLPKSNWKRVAGWIAVGAGAIVLLVVITVVVLLHSQRFHKYVLAVAEQKASAAIGSQARARDFSLYFSGISPTVDLYDVGVNGAEPLPSPPLLKVDHIRIGVTITSLLRRTWYLNNVTLEHPVMHVMKDPSGADNLPNNTSRQPTNAFDLGVRHAKLDRGEIYYNNHKNLLDADLHDLTIQLAFDTAWRSLAGTLGYRDGHIKIGHYNPIPHDLQAEFTAAPNTFTVKRAVLTSGASRFVVSATLEDYANPRVNAAYDASLDAGELRRILNNASLPTGVLRLNGTLDYRNHPGRPALDTLTVNGHLSSRVLRVATPVFMGDVTDVSALYTLQNGNADVHDLRARLLGGELTATLDVRDLTGTPDSRLRANLRGLSLSGLKSLTNQESLRPVALAGAVSADADARWRKTTASLVATADATLQATITSVKGNAAMSGTPPAVPLNGVMHVRYSAPTKQITVAQSYIRLPRTSVTLNGTVSDRSSLQVRVQSKELHELETVTEMFRSASPGPPAQPLDLSGNATFVGNVSGSTSAPQITGRLTAGNLKVKGTSWKLLRTNVTASPSLVSLQNGELQPANQGRIEFDLSAGLKRWSFTKTNPIHVAVNAASLNLADLARVAGVKSPVSGTLAANVNLRGSGEDLVGSGDVAVTKAALIEKIQLLRVTFQGTGSEVRANLNVNSPAGSASGVLTYFPKREGYEGQLQANGIQLGKLQALQKRNLHIDGVMKLDASGRGTLADPGLRASIQVPQLTVKNRTMKGLVVNANVANHVANVVLDSQVLDTSVHGRAMVSLTGQYDANATLDTQPIALQAILAVYAPSLAADVSGETELHASLRGPLKDSSRLDAHVVIPTLQLKYKNLVQIGAADPMRIDFVNDMLSLQRARIQGTETDLQLQGTVPINGSAPISLLLLGTVNLRLAQLFDPDIASSGELKFNINSYGQRSDPNVHGQVQVVNANFVSGTMPAGLQNGNGVLTLTKDRLNITNFRGTVGGGELTASGGVVYSPSLRFDLALAGKGIRMLYPYGVRETFDTDLALTGTRDSALLRGNVRLDQLSFTPDFEVTNFISQFSGQVTPPPTGGFTQNLRLAVAIQSTSGINLASRTLSLQANANLRATGTAAQPVILGRINISGGDLIFNGKRFVLQAGTIDFANPTHTQPVVNVGVHTTIDEYEIAMHFSGPADHLRTNYSSVPALPPADIINLLAFGKTTEASAANPTSPGNAGAESLLASQVSNQVTSRVEKIAGISQLSVDPVLGSYSGENPGARLTIRQRVTSNLFVTFATDVTSTQRQTIQLHYQYSPRVSFSGTRDQNGGFGFDARIHKAW